VIIITAIRIGLHFSFLYLFDFKRELNNLMVETNGGLQQQPAESKNLSNDRFERLLESTPRGMHFYYLDDSGELIFLKGNQAADRILGIDHSQLIGKTIEQAFPGLAGTPIPSEYRKLATDGGSYQNNNIEYKEGRIVGAFNVVAFQVGPGEMVATFEDITERTIREEKIRKKNDFLSAMIESSPIPIFYKEAGGSIQLCNHAFSELIKLPREDIIGKTYRDILYDEKTIAYFISTEENLKLPGSSNTSSPFLILNAMGDPREIMLTVTNLPDSGKSIEGILGYVVDVSPLRHVEFSLKLRTEEYKILNEELQSAEEELRAVNEDLQELNKRLESKNQHLLQLNDELRISEERFRTAFYTSPDSINLNRLRDGLYMEINEGFTRITGYTPEDIKGKTSFDINIWADPESRKIMVSELLSKGYCNNLETVFRMKNGTVLRGIISARVIELEGEKIILSIARNIEDQKRSEEYLRESEERFRQLAENTNDVFWLWTGNKVLYVNAALKKIWGIDPEHMIDNPGLLEASVHPDDRDSFRLVYNPKDADLQKPHEEQYRIIRPDGEIRWIWSRTYPIRDEQGSIVRYAGIASDITGQKKIEKELIAAREQAVESDRLKSAFLANISHEIRTPMNGIIGFSELLDNSDLGIDKRKMYVDIVKSSGLQLVRIIDDIIDISKIEANQLTLNYTSCSLEKIMGELLLMYQKQLLQKGSKEVNIFAHCGVVSQEALIRIDETRLRQILINLINNSIKFTEAGEVRFGCDLVNNELRFFVADTGIGIPPEIHQQIFKRFRQGSETLSRKFGGTGLGLAISEGLVQLLGGRIWFESEPENGSVFYFTVPYIPAHPQSEEATKSQKAVPRGRWTHKQILVAEDDNTNFMFLQTILEPTGAIVIHAMNGEEAVKICRENENIAMVLMDIRMPILNGYEATRQIRTFRSELPVIAQTAYAMPEDQIKATQAGCNGYISKPINRHQLMEFLEKYLPSE
jgi:PAS domain S-box-containing protein